jgi:tetratricopeptide (TPR) repeat protein
VNPGVALASDAVQLFVSRAAAVQPGFVVTPANAETIAAICRRLDGLPLALELAAARVRLLPPAAILARLDRALPLLTDGPRDVPTRQRTMRDAIAWSYDLLSPEERTTFARMAVFVGGGTLAACEAVCTGDGEDSFAVLDRLTALLDNNLLVRETTGEEEDGASGPRIRMLEPIREYAAEQLAREPRPEGTRQGERAALRRRHATYYLSLAERERTDQSAWLRQVGPEHDNLRGALRWAFEREEEAENAILGLRLAAALWWFWEVRGHLAEGRSWIERALRAAPDAPVSLRAEAYYGGGALAIRQRDYAAADAFEEQSLALWRALGDSTGIARSLTWLAEVALRRGDLTRASTLLAESLALWRVLDNKVGLAGSVNLAGLVARDSGDYGHAWVRFEEALALWRELHRPLGIAGVLSNLGHLALRQGDAARAAELFGESLDLSWELGASWTIAHGLEGLAGVAAERGDFDQAARLWGAAEALREAIGAPLPPNLAPRHEELVAAARARANGAAWTAAWTAGRALSPEAAIAAALR